MRIAQIAPLAESVPPKLYGGTERVVYALVEELVSRGHDVTLFASGDSETSANLASVVPQALRLDARQPDPRPFEVLQLAQVFAEADRFDLIHTHTDYAAFPLARFVQTPLLSTLHGRLDLFELQPLFREFTDMPLVSISNNQRRPLPRANWLATVYNGIWMPNFRLERRRGDYLAFLGRITPEKRLDVAIQVAKLTGMPLKIAAKIDKVDRDYYEAEIKHLIQPPLIEYIGEITEREKSDFLGRAYAYLFPVDWPEPFGLTMVEAMACGTAVIARRAGSVPEVVVDGKTGFICDSVQEMVLAVHRVPEINPLACRERVQELFSAEKMADGYEAAYRKLLERADRRSLANGLVDEAALLAKVRPIEHSRSRREPAEPASQEGS